MPQTTVLQSWRAEYPIQAPAQKPPGIFLGPHLAATAAWLAGVVTLTTAAHNQPVGSQTYVTVSGFVPTAYNGRVLATFATATTITYPLAVNPGAVTTAGSASFVVLAAKATPNQEVLSA